MPAELLIGSFIRRSDDARYRVVRLSGTQTFRVYINGLLAGEYASKATAMKGYRR